MLELKIRAKLLLFQINLLDLASGLDQVSLVLVVAWKWAYCLDVCLGSLGCMQVQAGVEGSYPGHSGTLDYWVGHPYPLVGTQLADCL